MLRNRYERGEQTATAPTFGQKCLAEAIGTAFLVFVGCGSLAASAFLEHSKVTFTMPDILSVALGFGLAISLMVYAIGPISGCHINPAVSFAMACARRMSWSEAVAYMIAQFLGGIIGAALLAVVFGAHSATVIGYGSTDYNPHFVNYFTAIIAEAIGTFFLLFVIMGSVIDKRVPPGWSGFAVGLTVTAGILVLGAVTGGNFNPARAFGPTIVEMTLGASYPLWHMFVYFIGPAVGALGGVFTYSYLAHMRVASQRVVGHLEPGD
jgi:glycerol uptake facilitator protein